MKTFIMSKEFLTGAAVGMFVLPHVIKFVQMQMQARKPAAGPAKG